jgi:hypothetical protein
MLAREMLRRWVIVIARGALLGCVVAAGLAGCGGGGESSVDQCSNARDDDGDRLIDCADPACRVYSFCSGSDGGPPDAGPRDAAPRTDGAICGRPLDVTLVLDVSSSMVDELAVVGEASVPIFDIVRALDPSAEVRMVVFVDDALAIGECAPIADPAQLAASIEEWRVLGPANRSPVSGVDNQECAENALDALVLAAACAHREGSARVMMLVTDDTFAEAPAVLGGAFGGGVRVQHDYAETLDAIRSASAHVIAIALRGVGEDCGATRISPDVGRGYHDPHGDLPALPVASSGAVHDLRELRARSLDLAASLRAISEPACQ